MPPPSSPSATLRHRPPRQTIRHQNAHRARPRSRLPHPLLSVFLFSLGVISLYLLIPQSSSLFPLMIALLFISLTCLLLNLLLPFLTPTLPLRHLPPPIHRLSGERAAYVRTSQRLAMMDRDFTDADYEMLLDLDNNSQRLRRFLHGASVETIQRLPTFIFGPEHKGGSEDEDESRRKCIICLEEFEEGMKIRVLPCLHRFMAKCIDPWLAIQASCPICKCGIESLVSPMPDGCT